jgi:hypothetical protein
MAQNKMDKLIYEKIVQKKEFSDLPKKDVELAFKQFERRQTDDEEKIKLTRDLLRKVFSVFGSEKLLNGKKINPEFVLKKHISTRERLEDYEAIYGRIFGDGKNASVIDLGCGVNGFSFNFMKKFGVKSYTGVEAIGQLVNLTNKYFESEKISGKVFHESLFELEKMKKIIKDTEGNRIIFLFKTLDSLEMLERDYSKKLLLEIVPLVDKVVVSFATRSLVARKKFQVNRNWIFSFIEENFEILDGFETGAEKYLVFKKK